LKFPELWKGSSDDARPAPKIIFSLCHTTARLPDGWRAAAQAWLDNCDHPENVEHVLTWDDPAGFSNNRVPAGQPVFPNTIVGVNDGPKTAVAGWNLAAKLSTGKFIISLADDWFPCTHWDTEILKALPQISEVQDGKLRGIAPDLNGCHVLDVDTAGNDHLLTFSLLTRAYLNKYSGGEGWLFYPEYTGMYADNDFTDSARMDKVIVNARHLRFEHRHPNYFPEVEPDQVHLWQGRPEAFRIGAKVYKKRCAAKGLKIQPIIVVCLPGENFHSTWVAYWTNLYAALLKVFTVSPNFTFSSNVYTTRACLANQILNSFPLPDYVLWIDDDNLLSVQQMQMLLNDLEATPEADMVAGWAYVQPEVFSGSDARTSVGMFDKNGNGLRLTAAELMEGEFDMREVDYSGFPAVLMRGEMLEKAGVNAFAPIVDSKYEYGYAGEDLSFCIHAREKGCRIFVDRRVRVPHLKLRDAVPNTQETKDPAETLVPAFQNRRNDRAKELEAAAKR
jgi:hypothetical protein